MAKAKKDRLTIDEAILPIDEQPYELPENWCWVKHNSILDISGGSQPAKSHFISEPAEGYTQLYQTRDYGEHPIPVYIPDKYATKTTVEGDILLARYGGSLGKVFRAHDGAYNVALAKVIKLYPNLVDDEFLYQYYLSQFYQDFCVKASNGRSAQAGFNREDMDEIPFPLPPLAEQKRIVEQIENLFSKLDEAKVKAQFVVDSYDERKAAILYSAFTGKLSQSWRETNVNAASESLEAMYSKDVITDNTPCELPDNWCWVKMGALGYTNIGLTYSPSDKSDEGIIVLRSSNIQDGQMDYEDIVRVSMDIPENKMCKKGDLLICARNGSKALVGKTAIVDKDGMSYGAFMAIFRSEYNKYIYYFMSSPFFRNLIDSDVSTTTINQVTQGIIKNLMFPLAPVKEQEYISDKLKDILDKERSVRDMAVETIENIELTKKAILAKAFRGELGTNIADEESSIELLKSIIEA